MGTESQPLVNTVATAPRVAARARPAPGVRRSVWDGQYTCTQGLTSLRLTLERDGENVEATFEFGPLDSNPTVPSGAFRMTGVAKRDDAGLEFVLKPAGWIERPANYVMVALHASPTADGRMLRGRIDHSGCGALEVTRVD